MLLHTLNREVTVRLKLRAESHLNVLSQEKIQYITEIGWGSILFAWHGQD